MGTSLVRRGGQRLVVRTIWCLVLVLDFSESVFAHNDTDIDGLLYDGPYGWRDYHYLHALPLKQLLMLQRRVNEVRDVLPFNDADDQDMETRRMPARDDGENVNSNEHALPLNTQNISDRSSVEPWNTKPSKVQTIFQISITGLAFLAFAGYLLCMIVQAIKSKGTTYYHPTITGSATLASAIKKRKPFMRHRRDLPDRTPLDEYGADRLHQMVVAFAESYVHASSGS